MDTDGDVFAYCLGALAGLIPGVTIARLVGRDLTSSGLPWIVAAACGLMALIVWRAL